VNISGVCISQIPAKWNLPIPLLVHTQGWRHTEREVLHSRIDYLAERRNQAVTQLLKEYPETTHVLMIDSYYLPQEQETKTLLLDYRKTDGSMILGGAVWARLRLRISHLVQRRKQFYDQWAVPGARWMPYGWRPENDWLADRFRVPVKGFYRLNSVGGAYLFPRILWDNGLRYKCPDDLHGCEHNYFCEHSNLPVYLDLNVHYWREKKYGVVKCFRCSIGAWLDRMNGGVKNESA